MTLELKILPSGSLSLLSADEAIPLSPSLSELRDALSREIEEGLFLLVALKNETALTPSLLFWKDFTSLYLTKRCHHPEDENGVLPPLPFFQGGASTLILGAPPMQGGEYLSLSLLEDLWNTLDQWLLASLQKKQLSFAHFLEQSAPQWHSVGRVCFHLAESKKTPETPFAFLATYSSQISKGKIYHHTLGKALQEYAGSQNKKALIHLLSPVYRASESSPFIQKRVESGAIYEPQLWSPQEAYTFLREVPLYEEAGIVVRVPDWWQARSPRRPNVQITIDQKKQNTLNSESLLDFQIQLALGEETLSLSEWQELLNSPEDGLVFLKGQWIELDKEKLSQTLEHWKRVEKHYRSEGISFIEGMRLLAGAPPDLTSEPLETLPQWSRVQAGKNLEKILNDLRHPQNLESREIGSDLKTSLRPYQQQGVHWLFYLKQLGLGACLADDMGLGKTLQVLALLLLLKRILRPLLLLFSCFLLHF
jgi:hypothetical protein